LRNALRRAIEHNLGTLTTIKEQPKENVVPTFNLDLALLDACAHSKYDILNNVSLCAMIVHLRFELSHLARQIDALLQLELDNTAREQGNFVEGRKPSLYSIVQPQLAQCILARLSPLEKECKEALSKLNG